MPASDIREQSAHCSRSQELPAWVSAPGVLSVCSAAVGKSFVPLNYSFSSSIASVQTSPPWGPFCFRHAWLAQTPRLQNPWKASFVWKVRGKINDQVTLGVVCHVRSFLQPKAGSPLIFRKACRKCWSCHCRLPVLRVTL